MELRQLEYFVEFCKDLNFSKTAKRLYITPQGLSKAIHALEDDLQIPLTTSVNGRLKLTVYGEYLAKRGTHIVNMVEKTEKEVVHMYQLDNNNISINLSNTIRCIIQAQVHKDFLQQHPDITLNIHEYRDIECENKLLTGEVDAALSLGPLDPNLFQAYYLFDSPYTMMMHRSHRLAKKKVICFDDLVGEKLVGMDKNYKTYYLFDKAAKAKGVELQFVEYVDGALNSYFLCKDNHEYIGSLVGYLPQLLRDDSICYVPFDMDEFSLKVYVAILKERYKPYALRTYINFIRGFFV